jgi:hypothetical protein
VQDFLELIRVIQPTETPTAPKAPPPQTSTSVSTSSSSVSTDPLKPIDVTGFYKATGAQEATFYATTPVPATLPGAYWAALNITGVLGQIQTLSSDGTPGTANVSSLVSEPYNWSFKFQSDTRQYLEYTEVSAAVLYPPNTIKFSVDPVSYSIAGYYTVKENLVEFFFLGNALRIEPGWNVTGLLPFTGTFNVKSFGNNIYSGTTSKGTPIFRTVAVLTSNDPIPNNSTITYVTAKFTSPTYAEKFKPSFFTTTSNNFPVVNINPHIVLGKYTKFRDLNKDVSFPPEPTEFTEIKERGFSSGAILALFAKGPQDEFLVSKNPKASQWNPIFKQHTNAVMFNRVIPLPGPSPTYQGTVSTVILYPNQLGDLFSNMYLKVTVPSGIPLAPNIGRSIIKQVDFLVNETIIETLYDDWYIIRDQMLLDADEQYAMNTAMAGINNEIIIPLEFFFCRRHSNNNSGRERLRKPYFPICAMHNQLIYIRFTFQPYQWWTSDTSGTADISKPVIITEEILLEKKERLYYKSTPLRYIVNSIKKDATLTFTSNQPIINLTAAFPVQTLMWFFRNKNYERVTDGLYYDSRYNYGYTTQYIHSAVPMQFPSGNTNFIDVITSAKITLSNTDVTSVLPGGLYFGFQQPFQHFLSVPSKNIYSYSFGLTPKEYNQGGYLNFSKLNSQTTTMTLTFNPTYTAQVTQGYNLYVFYYGYNFLQFQGGFAGLPFGS